MTLLPLSAVFVDVENMTVDRDQGIVGFDIDRVMDHVSKDTRPIVRKAYADWSRLRWFREGFLRAGFDQVQTTYVNRSKNTLDMQMCVDALESALLGPEIATVVLVTSDSDFSPLTRTLRRHGKHVIGVGWEAKVNGIFRSHCDLFVPYESLPGDRAKSIFSQGGGRRSPAPPPPRAPSAPKEAEALDFDDPRDASEQTADPTASPGPSDAAGPAADMAAGNKAAERPARGGRPARPKRPLEELNGVVARLVASRGAGASMPVSQFGLALRQMGLRLTPAAFGFRRMTDLIAAHPLMTTQTGAGGGTIVQLPQRFPLSALSSMDDRTAVADWLAGQPVRWQGSDVQGRALGALHRAWFADPAPADRASAVAAAAEAAGDLPAEAVAAVEQVLWEAKAYAVEDRSNGGDPMTWRVKLREAYADLEVLQYAHDARVLSATMANGLFLPASEWALLIDGDDAATEDFADMLDELGFVADVLPSEPAVPAAAPQASGVSEPWGAVVPRPTGVLLSPRLGQVGSL